jgi:hypothetical protein
MIYNLRLREPQARFNSPSPRVDSLDGFVVELDDERATIRMTAHCADVADARAVVEPVLASWEASAALQGRRIVFEFERANVVDRDPPAGEIGVSQSDYVVATMRLSGSAEEEFLVGQYPPPPHGFVASPDVRTLVDRYELWVDGKEPLPAFAYFVLAYVEKIIATTRRDAAKNLNIDKSVLDRLGYLCTQVGTPTTARKIDRGWRKRPHAHDEWAFMEAATKALIRRAGEAAAQPASSLPRLTLADLPTVTTPRTTT